MPMYYFNLYDHVEVLDDDGTDLINLAADAIMWPACHGAEPLGTTVQIQHPSQKFTMKASPPTWAPLSNLVAGVGFENFCPGYAMSMPLAGPLAGSNPHPSQNSKGSPNVGTPLKFGCGGRI